MTLLCEQIDNNVFILGVALGMLLAFCLCFLIVILTAWRDQS